MKSALAAKSRSRTLHTTVCRREQRQQKGTGDSARLSREPLPTCTRDHSSTLQYNEWEQIHARGAGVPRGNVLSSSVNATSMRSQGFFGGVHGRTRVTLVKHAIRSMVCTMRC